MRVAVLWSRFGPYHLARLRGAAEYGRSHALTVIGLEVAQQDHYDWTPVAGGTDFERETLFPGCNYADLSSAAIRRAVMHALDWLRPDAVAVNGWSVAEARAALAWVRGRARAVIMSETKADEAPRVFWKEWLKRRIVAQARAGLVGGRKQADYLAALGMPRDRIALGYNAVDNAYFEQGAEQARQRAEALRAELNLPARYFFACTRFLPRKNLDGLLRAYVDYRTRMGAQAWDLVISGGGECERELHVQVQRDGLGDAVRFVGFRQYPELPVYYGLASAFVHPARTEAWGLVVNEAAASGLPLLVSRTVGAAHELVEPGVTGYGFDPDDTADIRHALLEISRMPEAARRDMGLAARRQAADFGPARFGAGLHQAVQAAMACPR